MKKLLAGLLLSIHLFNLGGYYVVYQYFVYKSDKIMNEHIAKGQYNVHDLIEVKIPVSLGDITSWKDYESVTGQIQFQNNCYNYVKLKLTTDTMYVKCIPNYEKTRLMRSNVLNVKQIADLPGGKHENCPIKKGTEDTYQLASFNFKANSTVTFLGHYRVQNNTDLAHGISAGPFMPPESVS